MYDVHTNGRWVMTAKPSAERRTERRLNFRVSPSLDDRLRMAAAMSHQTVTDFVLQAAAAHADEVLMARTVVPSDYFDELLAALDAPVEPMPELARAAAKPRRFADR
jgi:uncharacterized protein (DUF1778 family)